MRLTRYAAVLLAQLGAVVTAAHAQGREAPRDEPSIAAPIFAGAGLGLAGFLAGSVTSAYVFHRDCTLAEGCFEAVLLGGAAGGTIAMVVGTHVGNRRRGNLALDFLASAGTWGVGIGITAAAIEGGLEDTEWWVPLTAIPVVQLAATVAVERATGRARARRHAARASVVPLPDGGVLLTVSLPLR